MIIISVYFDVLERDYYRALVKGIVEGCDGVMAQDTLDTFQETYTASLLVLNTDNRAKYLPFYMSDKDKQGNYIIEYERGDNIRVTIDGKRKIYLVTKTNIASIIRTALEYTKEDTITIGGID